MATNTNSTTLVAASSQFWSISNAAQTGLAGGTMTIMGWVKITTLPTSGNNMPLVGKRNGTGNQRGYYFYINNNAGAYRLGLQTDDNGANPLDIFSSNISFVTGSWWFVAVTYTTGTGAIAFFEKQGAGATNAAGTGTGRTSLFSNTAAFELGSIADGSPFADCQYDEWMFFSAALAQATIDGIKDSCSNTTSLSNLVSWWKFDGTGNDEKAVNNLTNNNAATFTTDVPFTCVVVSNKFLSLMGVGT